MFDFSTVTTWFDQLLRGAMPEFWVLAIEFVLVGVLLLALYAVLALILILFERKICAYFQCRLGPVRVGPWGLFQSVADMVKILLKEIIPIKHTDKFLFYLAPFFVIVASFCTFGAIPFGRGLQAFDFNIGVFYLLAISSLGVIGILLAGWASNQYSMIGAMKWREFELRAVCRFVVDDIVVLLVTCSCPPSLKTERCLVLVSGHSGCHCLCHLPDCRTRRNQPWSFDLPEAESELTAGYHTEYSGIQFGFYYLAEYLNMFVIAAIATTVFLGGWMPLHIPGFDAFNTVMDYIPSPIWFFAKAFALMFLSLWVRWTFPRLRIDQLLNLEWYLLPINMVNLLLMVVLVIFGWIL